MSEQEHSQEPEEREEIVEDLDVPEEQAGEVEGGSGNTKWGDIELKRGVDN
jgi:hypothetical protein